MEICKIKNVGILNIKELFKLNLNIPVYQRPYLWGITQVENLLKDFMEIFDKNIKQIYLIGNMIFYRNEKNLEIVDGQQRIMTLALLLYNLDNSSTKSFLEEIILLNPLSKKAIYDNNNIIKNFIDRFLSDKDKKEKFLQFLYENILVTYIVAKTQDEAFIFFDSQNTRGKPLNRHDLLKAHHLRDIESQNNRIIYAKLWEEYKEEELKKLLEVYLTLNRNFVKGNYKFDVDVYEEFKSNNFTNELNNYNQPPIFKKVYFDVSSKKLKLTLKDDVEFRIGNSLVIDNAEQYLPFEVLQSIGGGEQFFWYISKYIGLKKKFDTILNPDIVSIVDSLSVYLREYFYAVLFLYYDKFNDDKFEEFSYLIVWIISHYRLNNYSVRYLGVRNFIRDYNVFVKLFFSYSCDEIIHKLNQMIKYELQVIDCSNIIKGIRKDYFIKINENKNLIKIAKLVKVENVKN